MIWLHRFAERALCVIFFTTELCFLPVIGVLLAIGWLEEKREAYREWIEREGKR